MSDSYHDRPEWSYSQMKVILDSGIDYAVAMKHKMLSGPDSAAIDLGELAHLWVLGGDAKQFVVSPYDAFRTKEAKAWRDARKIEGKTVIKQKEYDAFVPIVENIKAHPMSKQLILADNTQHEQELFAKVNDVVLRGKADALLQGGDGLIITDIKTTAQFDEWERKAMWRHYDLQAAVYSLIASRSLGVSESFTNFYFCVAETVAPYRVQFHHAPAEFVEQGQQKLAKCLEEIKKFGDRKPNFLIPEVNELGDFSL